MRGQWAKSPKEAKRLEEAGLSDDVIDDALAAFILEVTLFNFLDDVHVLKQTQLSGMVSGVKLLFNSHWPVHAPTCISGLAWPALSSCGVFQVIAKHGEPAPRLCNKDPFTLKSSVYLASLFPGAKFLLMIRDGRAVVNSIISRKITISGFDLKSFPACLQKWNQAMESMYYQCLKLGPSRCLPVYYEQLVLHPQRWLQHILDFLDLPWHDAVLHHEQYINQPGGISLSK